MTGSDIHYIAIDGLRIAFRQAGDGPPLLLLHGGISDSRVWRDQLHDLSDEFRVVAWDAPGCGRSSDPPETFRLPEYADCLAAFIDAVGLGRPHVLGHSFGGGLGLELYRRHPGIPRSLLLAGAYAGWAGSLPPEEVKERLRLALRMADQLPMLGALDSIWGLGTNAMPAGRTEEIAADLRPVGTRVTAHAFAEADLRDVLPRIAVPTLLLYGAADERAPLDVAKALDVAIPNSTLVTMPGLGHEAYLEAPQTFNAEVRRFLHSLS